MPWVRLVSEFDRGFLPGSLNRFPEKLWANSILKMCYNYFTGRRCSDTFDSTAAICNIPVLFPLAAFQFNPALAFSGRKPKNSIILHKYRHTYPSSFTAIE